MYTCNKLKKRKENLQKLLSGNQGIRSLEVLFSLSLSKTFLIIFENIKII